MVIDSSVLIAILLAEPDAEYYANLISEASNIYISAVSIFESSIVIESKKGEEGAKEYDRLLETISPNIVAFDNQQANLARIAWQNYGKGRHPAKLNFGDCCSYAIAKYLNQPLLFKGEDFSKTDIQTVS
jgi:ribonuclease VapC